VPARIAYPIACRYLTIFLITYVRAVKVFFCGLGGIENIGSKNLNQKGNNDGNKGTSKKKEI